MSKTHAIYAHVKRAASLPGPAVRTMSRGMNKSAVSELERYVTGATLNPIKRAEAASQVATGLRVRDALVHSDAHDAGNDMQTLAGKMAATNNGHAVIDPTKAAAAVLAIDRLTTLVSDLQQAHSSSVKVAAALAGAVKLAQDGVIDVEDIFDIARESLEHGTVKVSSVDALFNEKPGELENPDAPEAVKAATGRPVPGFSDASGQHEAPDVLTATLRDIRR